MTEVNEVHKDGWVERMGGSFRGVVTGLGIVAAAACLLWWNEGRAIKTAKRLSEGAGAVVSVEISRVDSANEGKLVHVSGKVETTDELSDPIFGISAKAISLSRTVEIYQWVETATTKRVKKGDKEEDLTTYSYNLEWCAEPVDSTNFKDKDPRYVNPPFALPYSDETKFARNVTLGAFALSESDISRIGGAKPFAFASDFRLPESLQRGQYQNGIIYIAVDEPASVTTGTVTSAGSPLAAAAVAASTAVSANSATGAVRSVAAQPKVGDMRVKFQVVEPHDISIVERQRGNTFVPWTASDGKTLSFLREGIVDAAAIFATAQSGNKTTTWFFRLLGFVLMFFGFRSVLGPFTTLVDVIPVLSRIVSAGVGGIAFLLTGVVSLLVIGVSWLVFRPVLGIGLLAGAAVLVGLMIMKKGAAAPVSAAR